MSTKVEIRDAGYKTGVVSADEIKSLGVLAGSVPAPSEKSVLSMPPTPLLEGVHVKKPAIEESKPVAIEPAKPTIPVTFHLGSFGELTAYYHQVIVRDNELLVLVYHTDYQGGIAFSPAQNQTPMKVVVHEHTYYAISTGINFELTSEKRRVSILLLTKPSSSTFEEEADPAFNDASGFFPAN